MRTNKIKEFVKNNWSDLATVGIVAIAEMTLVCVYKGYLKRLEKEYDL